MIKAVKKATIILFVLIIIFNTVSVAAINSEPDFLIGDWETSDGIKLSFSNNTYVMKWSGLLQLYETGYWRTGWQSGDTFSISFDGLGLFKIMELLNGFLVSNYHFEVLKCNNDNFYLVQVYGSYTAYTSPAKLAFTRVGAYKNFEIPKTPEPEKPDVSDNEELKAEEKRIEMPFDGDITDTIGINWGWEYFLDNAEKYNHNLAMAGLAISSLINNPDRFEDTLKNDFGFDDIEYQPYSAVDMPGYAFAHKSFTYRNQKKHIVLIAIRGTNANLSDVNVSDFITDIKSQVDGFIPSTQYIEKLFNGYINIHGCDRSNTILFITGHSLGGGIAQSFAPIAEKYVPDNSHSFIYTYAATNVAVNIGGYYNVHNIVNEADIVPYVPIGYKKYGRIWYYNSNDTEKYQEYFDKLCKKENTELTPIPWMVGDKHSSHQPETYFAMMICDLPRDMDSGIQNPYSLTSVECPVDITVKDMAGSVMGRTQGSTVTIESNSKILISIEGESKKIIAPPGVQYTVEIVGTGDGKMDVIHQLINPVTGQVVESKEYKDIAVHKSQKFEFAVDGRVTDELKLETSGKNILSAINGENSSLVIVLVVALTVLVIEILLLLYSVKHKRN